MTPTATLTRPSRSPGSPDIAERNEETRLVAAAWTVLERAGFEGFKVQLVMRETGLSARTFYRHFRHKDELVLRLMQEEYQKAAVRVTKSVAGAGDPVSQIAAWIDEIIQAAADPTRAARARLFTSQSAVVRSFSGQVDEAAECLLAPLREAIRRGCEDGLFPEACPEKDAKLIMQLATSAMIGCLAGRNDSIDEVVADTTRFALRGLGLDSRAGRGGG